MSDPLSVLRDYFIQKAGMRHDEQNIIIGDLKFPRNTLTAYKQDRGRGDPYPLEALYFLLQNPHLAGAAKTRAYNDECKEKNFSRVLLVDQKDVLAYLTGKTDTSQYLVSIDELASISAAPAVQAAKEPTKPERPEKRQREEPKLDLSDENMQAAKKQWAEKMEERPYKLQHVNKTAADLRQITPSDGIQQTTNAYVKADAAVTRSITEKERTLSNRGNYLHGKSGREFQHLLTVVRNASEKMAKPGQKPGTTNPQQPQRRDRYNMEAKDAYKAAGIDAVLLSAESKGGAAPDQKSAEQAAAIEKKKQLSSTPIIIVPQAQTALVTMLNVKELLEKGIFVSPQQKKEANIKKEDVINITHLEDGHNFHYKVVESADQMKAEDWARVVAVFVQGPEWQFKNWDLRSFGGKIVNMFSRVSAFYLEYEKDARHPNVLLWNVKVLTIHRTKRHFDENVMNLFWDHLKTNRRLASQRKAASKAA